MSYSFDAASANGSTLRLHTKAFRSGDQVSATVNNNTLTVNATTSGGKRYMYSLDEIQAVKGHKIKSDRIEVDVKTTGRRLDEIV